MFNTKKTKWRKLEHAAKIFPATSNKRDERVFRTACELNESVKPDILQQALDTTMEMFSMFSCVIRKGVFWNYLEESHLKAIVKQESRPPCSEMYIRDKKNLLFEVLYYENRISLDIFHALSDGTGAVQFFRCLVYHYLMLAHADVVKGPISKLNLDMSDHDKTENSFSKYYDKTAKKLEKKSVKSAKITGDKLEHDELTIIEGVVSTKKLLEIARGYKTTITVLLTAVFLQCIYEELDSNQKRNPVSLMIPVNLRNFFPSESMRNFFWWINLSYDFNKKGTEISDIISSVDAYFKTEITKEKMASRMNSLITWEKKIYFRMIPLEIKQLALQAAQMSSRGNTAIFSNVGKISMPNECKPYIRFFSMFTSTPKLELVTCSYEDSFTLSFTSVYDNNDIIKDFFRYLSRLGLDITIAARMHE